MNAIPREQCYRIQSELKIYKSATCCLKKRNRLLSVIFSLLIDTHALLLRQKVTI